MTKDEIGEMIDDIRAGLDAVIRREPDAPVGRFRYVVQNFSRDLGVIRDAIRDDPAVPDTDGMVVLSVARFDELRQAEADLQDVQVAVADTVAPPEPMKVEPLAPTLAMSHLQDIQGQIDVLRTLLDAEIGHRRRGLDFLRNRVDEFLAEARHLNGRFDAADGCLKSFAVRLGEVEARRDGFEGVVGDHSSWICGIDARLKAIEEMFSSSLAVAKTFGPLIEGAKR